MQPNEEVQSPEVQNPFALMTSPEAVNTVVRRLQWDGSVVLGTVVNRGDETAMGN